MQRQPLLSQLIPYATGVMFIALFVALGIWQLDRAAEKVSLGQAFDDPGAYVWISADINPPPFQSLEVSGRYLVNNQIIVDNVPKNGRLGVYVITPFEYSGSEPLLLVNRGWLAKPDNSTLPDVAIAEPETVVRGKAGHLPRVGIRPGEAFEGEQTWPRLGVWPTFDEVAAELGRDVLPFALLLDEDRGEGYLRAWAPPQTGVSTHYGYAFQWFAMAATVLALLVWHSRRRWHRE